MTDVDIKKAFECCEANEGCSPKCEECPCFLLKEHSDRCYIEVRKQVLDLINRKNSRIAELTEENNRQKAKIELLDKTIACKRNQIDGLTKLLKRADEIKAEAIKELMFNLDEEISTYSSAGHDLNVYEWLKNYVKEMVGEK